MVKKLYAVAGAAALVGAFFSGWGVRGVIADKNQLDQDVKLTEAKVKLSEAERTIERGLQNESDIQTKKLHNDLGANGVAFSGLRRTERSNERITYQIPQFAASPDRANTPDISSGNVEDLDRINRDIGELRSQIIKIGERGNECAIRLNDLITRYQSLVNREIQMD